MARGMFNINDPDAGPVKVTIGQTSLPGDVDYGTIPSDLLIDTDIQREFFQDFIEIFRESQAEDDGRLERQTQAAEWLRVLGEYAVGNATEEDLKAVDVSDLMDVEGFEDYYYNIVPRPETEDTEEQDPNLVDLIKKHGQEAVDDAQRKLKELEAILNKTIDDPFGTLEGIIQKTASSSRSSPCGFVSVPGGTGLPEWVRECVTVGVGLPIPFPLPGPLGSIFKGAAVGEIEEAIKNAGYEIGKVLRGETSIEDVLDDLGEWIGDKVKGVLGDAEGSVSIESVLGAIGGFLPNVAAGVIWSTFQNKIENKIGLPILLTTEDGTEDSRCRDAEGNLTPWGERNPASCGQPVIFEESDLFGTGGLDSTVECDEGTLDEKGNCICPDGTLADVAGKCADTVVDTEVDPRCSNPAFAARNPSLCGGQTTYTEGPGFGSGGQPPETRCTGGKVSVNGECVCPDGTTEVGGECVSDTTGGNGGGDGGGEDQCTGGKVRVNGECVCPSGTTEINGQCVSVDDGGGDGGGGGPECPAKGTVIDSGCDGTTFFIRFADGECGEIYDSVPGYAGCGDGGGTTTTGCSNGATEESGCDTCPDGTSVLQHEDGICPSVSPPLDCSNPAYAAANPQECGTGPECIDCSCAEYAAANPDECGTTPPPETTSGGGGGGGGAAGGSGMFDLESFEITGDPQLLAKMEFPITDFLSGMFKDYV